MRTGDVTSGATVYYATSDGSASQSRNYTPTFGTLRFAAGETSKSFSVLITDEGYATGDQTVNLSLSETSGATLGNPASATLLIIDNDPQPATENSIDFAQFFVRQHYADFLNRMPDSVGLSYWSSQITQCGADQLCQHHKRVDVSNAFFFEQEFQQTGAFIYRLYRIAYGNNQPFPNPQAENSSLTDQQRAEARRIPSYAVFSRDRAQVVGGPSLVQSQLAFATAFVQRPEFLSKYGAGLDSSRFIDEILATIKNGDGADLDSQRTELLSLYNLAGGGTNGRAAVMYYLADDNRDTNPIDNRALIDAEYNRAFVATQYFGYLRRNPDINGYLFWLSQVNDGVLRDTSKQHAMVCSFITSSEYQLRFSNVVTHSNQECQQ
jgi:hypothetical protein